MEKEKLKLKQELEREKRSTEQGVARHDPPKRPPRITNRKDTSEESDNASPPPKRISPLQRKRSPIRIRRSPSPRRRIPSPRRRSVSPRRRSPVRRPPPRRRPSSSPQSVGSRSPSPSRRKRSTSLNKPMKLHVGNLTRNINKDHILEIFSVYGRVRSIDLPLDTKNYLPRGYAYVEYDQHDDAKQALRHMNGGWIDGQIVTAKEVLSIEPTGPPTGNRGRTSNVGRGRPPAQWQNRRRSPPRYANRRPPLRRSRSPRRRSRSPRGIPRRRRGSVSSGSSSASPPRRKMSPPSGGRRRRYSRSSTESD